jgi:hypothetical protein
MPSKSREGRWLQAAEDLSAKLWENFYSVKVIA